MDGGVDNPQRSRRSTVDHSEGAEIPATRRRYSPPSIDRRVIVSVVMGGSGRKAENHPHQTNRHP